MKYLTIFFNLIYLLGALSFPNRNNIRFDKTINKLDIKKQKIVKIKKSNEYRIDADFMRKESEIFNDIVKSLNNKYNKNKD